MDGYQNLHIFECWERLASHQLGRLAYHLLDEVHIVPINYIAHDGGLVFRTTEGSKLLGVVMHQDVAFEIDEVHHDHAWSVIARGRARVLEGEEARAAEQLPLVPWTGTDKRVLVAIEVTEVSGREFRLDRNPEQ